MNVPDAATGKRVKCPKCQTVIAVPAAEPDVVEVGDDEPTPPPRKSVAAAKPPTRPAPARRDDDDDDEDRPRPAKAAVRKSRPARDEDDEDDYDDDEPRPRRGKKGGGKKKGMSGLTIGLIAAGALVVLGGVGYGVYALAFKEKDKTVDKGSGDGSGTDGKAKVPDGWKKVDGSAAGFTAYLPGDAKEMSDLRGKMPLAMTGIEQQQVTKLFMGQSPDKTVVGMAMGATFGQDMPPAVRNTMSTMTFDMMTSGMAKGSNKPKVLETTEVPWLGVKAKQTVLEVGQANDTGQMVVRMAVNEWGIYVGIIGMQGGRPKPEYEKALFDNFEVTAPPAPTGRGKTTNPVGGGFTNPGGGNTAGTGGEPKAKGPDGWKQVDARLVGFTASMPGNPVLQPSGRTQRVKGKLVRNPFVMRTYMSTLPAEGMVVQAVGMKFDPGQAPAAKEKLLGTPDDMINELKGGPKGQAKILETKDVTWGGRPAKHYVVELDEDGMHTLVVFRRVLFDDYGYFGVIMSKNGRPKQEVETAFFDSFEFLK
jgi:hypothetical protein